VKTTALAGGVGGAKLLVGLDRAHSPGDLTAVVNIGDDDEIYGVHVAPDLDIVTYWLAGIADTDRGWGIRGDAFTVVDAIRQLGGEAWFGLGDRDFGTCIHRTDRLRAGATLSAVTDDIRRALGIKAILLPASDDPVRTKIITDTVTLDFQEYFVRDRQKPIVQDVTLAGIADAKPAPGVIPAIESADRVVLCPSNPVLSIGPILALPGVREALRNHPRVIAVTPIVRDAALKGPAAEIMRSMSIGRGAAAVARLYSDFVNTFVVDSSDADQLPLVEELGLHALALNTIMNDHGASERLALSLLTL
jgi:LPPG:FO 2-phospho-L-lactate transferase